MTQGEHDRTYERLARIETLLEETRNDVKEIRQWNGRLRMVEQWQSRAVGALAVVSILSTGGLMTALFTMMR